MPSGFRTVSGKTPTIGQGVPQAFPIQLDPAPFEGAIVYADDGTLKYSDGTQWLDLGTGPQGVQGLQGNTGTQGIQGDYGPGFTIIGSVADVNSTGDPQTLLSTTFPTANIGEGVIDDLLDELWIYDGTNWVNIGSFRGVQGFQGVQGNQGVQGQLGYEGIQGTRGFRGDQGVQGPQGSTGIQGDRGFQGTQGFIGAQGPQGLTGLQGDQGVQGFQGAQGIQGPQAFQGVQGLQGPQGPQGLQGLQGPQAFQGPQGLQGLQGPQGLQGIQGSTGQEGLTGGLTFIFNYDYASNGNTTDPGNTYFYTSVNDLQAAGTFTLYIDDFSAIDGPAVATVSGAFANLQARSSNPKAFMLMKQRADAASDNDYTWVEVDSLTDQTTHWELTCTYVDGRADWGTQIGVYGQLFELNFNFVGLTGGTGIQGAIGPQGNQGTTGSQGPQGLQGLQGPQGLQGTQGPQGTQGTQGPQGLQGLQGPQGVQGTDGESGVQGATGSQGLQGSLGLQGEQGEYGGLTFQWNFNSNTTQGLDPGVNNWKLNSSDPVLATQLYIDDIPDDQYNTEIDDFLDWIDGLAGGAGVRGYLKVQAPASGVGAGGHHWLVYEVNDWTWDGVGKNWGYFTVSHIDGNVSNWNTIVSSHGTETLITFIPIGAPGVQGATGIQGGAGVPGPVSLGPLDFGYQLYHVSTALTDASNAANIVLNNASFTSTTQIAVNRSCFDNIELNFGAGVHYVGDIYAEAATRQTTPLGYLKILNYNNPDEYYALYSYSFIQATDQPAGGAYPDDYYVFDVNHIYSQGAGTTTQWYNDNGGAAAAGSTVIFAIDPSGDRGLQGIQGPQGPQGTQGTFGIQGDLGPQGVQGQTGLQGNEGEGQPGGFTYLFNFSNNTTPGTNPGVSYFKTNNNLDNLATVITIDDLPIGENNDIDDFYDYLIANPSDPKGHLILRLKDSVTVDLFYEINNITWDSGSQAWATFDVTAISTNTVSLNGIITANGYSPETYITFIPAGPAGIQGSSGAQGATGIQGPQGVQGVQGTTGEGGTQGATGIQGAGGFQGDSGGFGGVTFDYTYSTSNTAPNPFAATGVLSWNASTAAAATIVYMGDRDDYGVLIEAYLRTIDDSTSPIKGHMKVSKKSAPADFALFTISGLTESASYFAIDVAYVSGNNNAFIQGEDVIVTFARTGDTGPGGLPGSQGFQGTQGIQGDRGFQGATGAGAQGTQGLQGANGINGSLGTQGALGPQGIQGLQGGFGPQGFGGTQGPEGQGDQGVQGVQGAQGFGQDGTPGSQGAQGLQGVQGPQGTQGLQGNQGAAGLGGGPGSPGAQGLQGVQGVQGAQGIQGDFGTQGAAGVGDQGIQGERGFQGLTGNDGVGSQGPQGIQGGFGPQGADGATSDQGVQGFQGPQGLQGGPGVGEPGIQGGLGPQGFQGFQGSGEPGFQGPQGTIGPQGFQGYDGGFGVQGYRGFQGFDGPQGFQGGLGVGNQGFQGPQGANGFQGPQGFDGGPGQPGIQGYRGFQGFAGEGAQGPAGQGAQGGTGPQGPSGEGFQGPFGPEGPPGPQGAQGASAVDNFAPINSYTLTSGDGNFDGPIVWVSDTDDEGFAQTYATRGVTNTDPATGIPDSLNRFTYNNTLDLLKVTNINVVGDIDIVGPNGQIDIQDGAFLNIESGATVTVAAGADISDITDAITVFLDETNVAVKTDGGLIFDTSGYLQFRDSSTNNALYFGSGTADGAGDWKMFQDAANGFGGTPPGGLVLQRLTALTTLGQALFFSIRNPSNEACFLFSPGDTSTDSIFISYGDIQANGDVISSSDARFKENIITIDNALEKVLQLRGVYFNKINDELKTRKVGVIAQEVMEVLPEVVVESNIEEEDYLAVSYGNMVGLLIEAMKEQQSQIDDLKKQIEDLKNK